MENENITAVAEGKPSGYKVTKKDLRNANWRWLMSVCTFNYQTQQGASVAYALSPVLRKIYTNDEDYKQALNNHFRYYNTQPWLAAIILGACVAMEERDGLAAADAVQDLKIGTMGPLAGVGDPAFWFTLRPILDALGASMALSGSIAGPLLFFFAWNIIRYAFLWYTQEFGYKVGSSIAKDLSGGLMGKVTEGASILGMFIIGALVERWVSISFTPVVSKVTQSAGAFIDWANLPSGSEGVKEALTMYNSIGANALDQVKVTTLQANLDQLIPGLAAVCLTLLVCKLLKKKVSPIVIILALFAIGIIGRVCGFM